jgi:hypothetical protein
MKIIFLDHDSVMCLSHNQGSRHKKWKKWNIKNGITSMNKMDVHHRFDNFDKKAVKILNEILLKTNAEIVVSSDWKKYATLDELNDFYIKQGVIKGPVSITPSFSDPDLESNRCLEIKKWLEVNKVSNWVAVDDLRLNEGDNKIDLFVLCDDDSLGIKKSGVKEKVIDILNGNR